MQVILEGLNLSEDDEERKLLVPCVLRLLTAEVRIYVFVNMSSLKWALGLQEGEDCSRVTTGEAA